jgi:hypothetical protein
MDFLVNLAKNRVQSHSCFAMPVMAGAEAPAACRIARSTLTRHVRD